MTRMTSASASPPSNFLRSIIDNDLASGRYADKRWAGKPGPACVQEQGSYDAARIRTRFPPEPNGYLHIGHAKSICLNFGLAQDYGGACHLRFDDTNPEKEEDEYVRTIIDAVSWLGFTWEHHGESNCYFASDYFTYRTTAESLTLLREMRDGKHSDGSLALRARIDMGSPNINLRDPVLYRIRHASHHRTGRDWCIYPMYAWAHPVEDALEGITHSICTLEFEDQRPFYDWILNKLADLGQLRRPLPRQYEFARLNLTYVITSKRKLLQLVREGHVEGWDDPRMPTLVGLRRRGFTPQAIRLFCERLGVSRADSRIDYSLLEQALRDDLDPQAARSVAILDPVKLIIDNYPQDRTELCHASINPHRPEDGQREFPFSRELWIERDDFREDPPKKYFRLFPGNTVRLKYGYIVTCTGCVKDEDGRVVEVHAEYLPETKSGTPGSDAVKVKGTITWVSVEHAVAAEVRLYDRLFADPHPDAGNKDFLAALNPDSRRVVHAWLEPGTRAHPGAVWQFERLGYFVADRIDSSPEKPIINRAVTLRDSWA